MTAPISPFFTSLGPASATAPGYLTTGTQTIAGAKTWSDAATFSSTIAVSGTATFNKESSAGAAETMATMGVSDVLPANGLLTFGNNTATDASFTAYIQGLGTTSRPGLSFYGNSASDTGTTGLIEFFARIGSSTAPSTRPLFTFNTGAATQVAQITAAGGFVISGGTTPSIKVGASGTAITQMRVYSSSLTPASVAAGAVAEQTFTVTGLTTGDTVNVNPPSITAGVGIAGVRVSAADTLAITFVNPTAGALTPAAGTYKVTAIRS